MTRRKTSRLATTVILFGIPLALLLVFGWAFHIGGRWTPLSWYGSGTLVSKSGSYPIFLMFYPASGMSRLHLDGHRPTSGVAGAACVCTSRNTNQYLKLSGTIYDGWPTTDGSLMEFRLLEPTIVDVGQKRAGYFDLVGSWHGRDLVMDSRGSWSPEFRSGLRIERPSVTLHWHPYWSCESACESAFGTSK